MIKYKDIIQFWLKEFPEFNVQEWNKDNLNLPHIVFADFADFLINKIEEKGRDDTIVQKTFTIINNQFNDSDPDPEVLNLLQVEIFENLSNSKFGTELAWELLSPKALEYFKNTKQYFGKYV